MLILIVEDDPATAASMGLMLRSSGNSVQVADNGEDAIAMAKDYDFDVITLDLMLPDMSGFQVLRAIRTAKIKTPIIIVSGAADIESKVRGLGLGADDYLTKSFHKDELLARIHAVSRRSRGHAGSEITVGGLVVNLDNSTTMVGGVDVRLTAMERRVLELLALRKGSVCTKERILAHLYAGRDEREIKIVDVCICKIRKKLAEASGGQDYIETKWGIGYRLSEPSAYVPARVETLRGSRAAIEAARAAANAQ